MEQSTTPGVESEREFHNLRFSSNGGVRPQAKYYYGLRRWQQDYYSRIASECRASDVLEYGCGMGEMSFYLAKEGGARSVLAIDISDVAVEAGNRRAKSHGLKHLDFRVMDAHNLSIPDCSFDVVIGSGILHHLVTERALCEVSRVLRPGGVAIFGEPLGTNPLINFYRRMTPEARTVDEHPFIDRDFDICREYFSSTTITHYGFLSLGAVPLRRWGFAGKILDILERADGAILNRTLLWRLGWMSLIELREPLTKKSAV